MSLSSYVSGLLGVSSLGAIALLTYTAQPAAAQTVTNGSLTVALSGLSNTNGQVCVSLFDNSGGFPDDDDAVVTQQCVAADGSAPTNETAAETGVPDTDASEMTISEADSPEIDEEGLPEVEEPEIEKPEIEEPEAESEADESEQADVVIIFPNLVSGTYAVSVLHDENGDQQMNQGAFGIPTEGFGFSRNPTITTGAPEFSEVAIFVLGHTTADIELIYF